MKQIILLHNRNNEEKSQELKHFLDPTGTFACMIAISLSSAHRN